MIENFIEYMWYLITTPMKKIKKTLNKWYILCRVFGKRFDEVKEDILRARDEGMVATCSPEMLQIHGEDRMLTRYYGEHVDNYRSRIAMYEDICRLGGTNEGILIMVKALGYEKVLIMSVKDFYGDIDRWAEFIVIIEMYVDEMHPINIEILKKQVRRVKEVGAKDNYLFIYRAADIRKLKSLDLSVKYSIPTYHFGGLRLDGSWYLDGSRCLDAYYKITHAWYKGEQL